MGRGWDVSLHTWKHGTAGAMKNLGIHIYSPRRFSTSIRTRCCSPVNLAQGGLSFTRWRRRRRHSRPRPFAEVTITDLRFFRIRILTEIESDWLLDHGHKYAPR
jgi:hypothetical protein